MGRFYQTSTPTFVDNKMFQLPFELMGKVLEKKDSAIQSDIDTTVALADTLKAQGLKVDEDRLNEKIGGYQTQIDAQVDAIKKNVLGYDATGINKLKRDITTDWTRGEVAAIEKNRASHLADLEQWKELAKKDPTQYTQEYLDKLAQESLAGYKGVNYKGASDYSVYKGLNATGMPDLNVWVEEKLKGAIPNVTSVEREGSSGGWRIKTGKTSKVMSEQDLNAILEGALKGDPTMRAALTQRKDFQMAGFTDLFDEKGEILTPVQFDEKGNRAYRDNILGSAFNAGLEKFGFSETGTTVDSKADWVAQEEYKANQKKKEEGDEFVVIAGKGTVTPYGGTSQADFNKQRTEGVAALNKVKESAMTVAMRNLGYADEAAFKAGSVASHEAISKGDYVAVLGDTEVARQLQQEYKQLKFEQNMRNTAVTEYRKTHKAGTTPAEVRADGVMFDKWLASRGAPVIEVTKGWGYIPEMTVKKQDQLFKQLKNSGHLENATLNFPKGSVVTNKTTGEKYDLSEYASVNDMVKKGVAKVVFKKTGVVTEEQQYYTNPDGVQMPMPMGTIKVIELMDGTELGNLEIPSNSVIPVFGASDDGNVQLQANFNLGGMKATAMIKNVSSTSIDKFNQDNATKLAGRKRIAKIGNYSADLSPNQDGSIIYHGESKGQTRPGGPNQDGSHTYVKGTVEIIEDGKSTTYDMDNPIIENIIYNKIFN